MYEAIQQTSGYVVRAVPDDAKFPIIMFDESGEPAYSALPYGSEIELDSGEAFAIYVDDGDPCISPTRELTIETATADSAGNERFLLKLTQTTSLGVVTTGDTLCLWRKKRKMTWAACVICLRLWKPVLNICARLLMKI